MKYIKEKDNAWHDPNIECPAGTTDVEFLFKDGSIKKGEVVVEMSGCYAYIRDKNYNGWENLNELKWRFIQNNKSN